MDLQELKTKVERTEARLAVIGLGYVGLPVAALFADAGYDVIGVEIRAERVAMINAGRSPIEGDEPGLAELLEKVVGARRMRATSDYNDLRDRDIILIDVETPVDELHIPRYDALRAVARDLAPVLKPGALVIVESTIAPGTMQGLVLPLLQSGGNQLHRDFALGNCPERVMPGKLLANLRSLSRVLGGGTPETAEVMRALYRHIVQADLDATDWITAELVKTTENAYRDVQIAFANEVALICEAAGADVWKVRELVNKSPFRNMHLPGAGVGGHCIPKDPWLLAHGVQGRDVPLRLIPAARAINDGMPVHAADLLAQGLAAHGRELAGARVLVMGFAYLENSDDTRNSPSEILVDALRARGAQVVIQDPFVPEFNVDLLDAARGCDAAVVMVAHRPYAALDWAALQSALNLPVLVDGRRVLDAAAARAAGWTYLGIGVS